MNAVDPDTSRSGSIVYGLPYQKSTWTWSDDQPVNSGEVFQSIIANAISVDSSTGVVSLVQSLGRDYPSGLSNWQFSVVANDESGNVDTLRGYGYVNLILADRDDHVPAFDTCCLNGSIIEGAQSGETLRAN